jgi:ATP-dependent DNA helicase RecQ
MLLRSYTGLFNDYVRIDEVLISRRLNMTPDELYQNLKYLSQQKIIHYIPRRNAPVVQFLTERVEHSRIRLSAVNYQDRKANYQKRVDSVIDYALSGGVCRSARLLAYFGERESNACGQCDVCKGEHKSGISNYEFESISLKIKKLLLDIPMDIKELITHFDENEKAVLKVARWLLDQQTIITNDSNQLILRPLN